MFQKELRKSPRKSRPNRQETYYLVPCPMCGQERWLRKSDVDPDRLCSTCSYKHIRANKQSILKSVQRNQRANPSKPERLLLDWFQRNNVQHIHQSILGDFVIDFEIGGKYIEVNGYWHYHDPGKISRDQRLEQFLGDRLLVVKADDLVSDFDQTIRQIETFVKRN